MRKLHEKILDLVDLEESFTASQVAERLSTTHREWSEVHSEVFRMVNQNIIGLDSTNRLYRKTGKGV